MSAPGYRELAVNGLWKNNPALVQLLGLCPLLAVSGSVVTALGLGMATCFVLMACNTAVSMLRTVTAEAIRLPTFAAIIAAAVTCTELLMQAYRYPLYEILGIFVPLIAANSVILSRADAFARHHAVLPALYEGLMTGLGFTAVLLALGALRELAGTGALCADMDRLFGAPAAQWQVVLFDEHPPFLLAILPPGAFIFTGLLIALKNLIDERLERRPGARAEPGASAGKRVRVTGI